jgi:short-subunit dehydrogenase
MSIQPSLQQWKQQTVWIMGASSGIGHATAELLLRKGATVYISARHHEPLDALAQQYNNAIALPVDVCDTAGLAKAYQTIAEAGPLDLYLHCAADYVAMRAWQLDSARMQKSMNINYGGVLNALAVILPDMLTRQSGRIAIIASVAGYMGMPQALAYGPTKAALNNLCEAMHVDLAPRGIGVQVINPGFVETPLTANNDFKMPALISPEQAATALVDGLEHAGYEISFPKRFTWTLSFVKRLPNRLRLHLLGKVAERTN